MQEFDIIRLIASHAAEQPGTALGIGDDAALLDPNPPQQTLVEACEIISFDDTASYEVNLSEVIKALDSLAERLKSAGYQPRWLLSSVALITPAPAHVDALDACLAEGCQQHRIQLIGGDITRGHPGITLRMLGTQIET